MIKKFNKRQSRKKRQLRIRNKVYGTPQRPRLTVFKSNTNVYAQIIDDVNGRTIVSASTIEKDLKNSLASTKDVEAAKKVGQLLGERAKGENIEEVVFDRSGYQYHGKIKAIADGAREAGLKF